MAYGYVGVDVCRRCNKPEHLFVSSMSQIGADTQPMCTECQSFYSSEDNIPTPVPVMYDKPNCEACGRPEHLDPSIELSAQQRWQFITAHLADGERAIIVHRYCSTDSCNDCNTVYAITRYRNYRHELPIPNSDFVEFEQIEGEERCTTCANAIYDEAGGRDNWRSCDCCEDIQYFDNML